MRLQKYLSAAGLCSRREAESWIAAGRVAVNGRAASLGDGAEEGDLVTLDGKEIALPAVHTYIMLHKPCGYVTTMRDERGRPTVAELTADVGARVYPVGRLDWDSEGLLLLTDDGETANRLMHPSHGVAKTYRALVRGAGIEAAAERLRHPLQDGEDTFRGAQVRIESSDGTVSVLELTIREGKNREIRRMCAAVGLTVLRLRRIAQGELLLGELPCGKWRTLTAEEIEFLRHLA